MGKRSDFVACDEDLTMHQWYKSAVGDDAYGTTSHVCTAITGRDLQSTEYTGSKTSDIVNDWFYELPKIGEDRERAHIDTSVECNGTKSKAVRAREIPTPSVQASLDKPLPAIPTPYFEYMFASAGIENETISEESSLDNLSFESKNDDDAVTLVDSPSSTPDVETLTPASDISGETLDLTTLAQFAFAQAGIDITTKDVVDNHFASLDTGLAGQLNIDEADLLEKDNVSAAFYGGIEVEESPGPYHAPIVDQVSGFTDIREGLEEFPEQWNYPSEETPTDRQLETLTAMVYKPSKANFEKPILKPKSQKSKLYSTRKTRVDYSLTNLEATVDNDQTDSASIFQFKKRPVEFVDLTKDLDTYEDSDDEVQYICTKKARITRVLDAANIECILPKQIGLKPPVPRGYMGQFHPFMHEERAKIGVQRYLKAQNFPNTHTFGDLLHPNYIFTHTSIIPDSEPESTEFTRDNLFSTSLTYSAIQHASEKTDRAAADSITVRRTTSEENLRREAHIECAAARLEGVAVGHYRYYQGHLTIEEYKDARICICWGMCSCSKLCTRFGDIICPCSKHIVIHKN